MTAAKRMGLFHRIGHLKETPVVKTGAWVKRGQLIGYCGTSGNSSGPHAHYDIFNTDKYGWTFYVYGWSRTRVQSVFIDPRKYCTNSIPMKAELPSIGYQYLQLVRDTKNGLYAHPGTDLNGFNDLGKPIYSPVEGRVRCVLGTSWIKNAAKKLVRYDFNQGWGCCVVIEEKPGFNI
jgi:murein DD-endopeptidase MepM/ murein hydrolase activator NlpD